MRDAAKTGVPVTGMGCICAAGGSVPSCLAALHAGGIEPRPPDRIVTDHPEPRPVFEVRACPAVGGGAGRLRTARLALAATAEALAAAGLAEADLAECRVGVCLGTTIGCSMDNEAFYRDYRDGRRPDMAIIDRFLGWDPATTIARRHRLHGPRQNVLNACSSGADAVGLAAGWIRAGLCDIAVAGGAEELSRVSYLGFATLMAASPRRCRPFDRDRDGLNLGEGAGILVLEAEDLRVRRGAYALGRVLGYGAGGDAHHMTAPHPEGLGLRRALTDALGRAGVEAGDVAFVNAHGTGTPDNDRVEGEALADLLPGVPYASTKGSTGHALGAAGAIEAVFTLAALRDGRLPPNHGCRAPDPDLPAPPVLASTPVAGSVAVSTSLGFGGSNAALVLGTGS